MTNVLINNCIDLPLEVCYTCQLVQDLTSHNYTVSTLSRFSSNPTKSHWMALKCVIHNLKGTNNFGIKYSKNGTQDCICYSDADWAGDVNVQKSNLHGYLSGGAVIWSIKK